MSSTPPPGASGSSIVPARPAATVMIIRDLDDVTPGVEVFMLRRTLSAAFASGMYVFPGGRVEAADGEDVDRAHRLAAIRECFEEAGILLAHRPDTLQTVVDGHPALAERVRVHAGEVDLLDLCAQHGLVPAIEQLVWIAHWVTPESEGPRRFDTRFYVVPAPPGQTSRHDDTETIASLWTRPQAALRRQHDGALMMMPPTIANLEFLARFDSVAEVMEQARALPPPRSIMPKVVFDDRGRMVDVVLPDDARYDAMP